MDAFERDFDAHQNSRPPHERYDELTRNAIMMDKYVEFAGGKHKGRIRGQGNTSSLVHKTPTGFMISDPGCTSYNSSANTSTGRSHAPVDVEELERRIRADNEARVQAEVAAQVAAQVQSQVQSQLEAMRATLRAEAREDMELILQRALSQRDQERPQYQRHDQQQPQQQSQIPQRRFLHPQQQPQNFQQPPFRSSSSVHEVGGSSRLFHGQTYQEDGYRPVNVDLNQSMNTGATLSQINFDMMNDDVFFDTYLNSYPRGGNQGGDNPRGSGRGENQGRSAGGGSGRGENPPYLDDYYRDI